MDTLPIYLDYNATTPIDPAVAEAMLPCLKEHFGNPSSSHPYGRAAKAIVDRAREQVARLLNGSVDEIVFTSGGTESNNHALRGAARALRERGRHIITSAVEHPAVTEVCRDLEEEGFKTTYLPVDGTGRVDPAALEKALTPETILVSVMHSNNEVGTIQPIREIAAIARRHGAMVHTDAAQSAGKVPVDVRDLGVDLLSVAGHKLYAPKGIGALYIRSGCLIQKIMHGAGHEQGRRAGTENVASIAGLGLACEMARDGMEEHVRHMTTLRDRLHDALAEAFPGAVLNGHPTQRLPNTLSLAFPGIRADRFLQAVADRVAASAGAACHSGGLSVSHVLEAMKVPRDVAFGTIRFSTGRMTTPEEIDRAVEIIRDEMHR